VIGISGGSVTDTSGAQLNFPAGAVQDDTTFRIAADSTGAPPIPTDLITAGNVYVITPHGGHFTKPVEVSLPVPAVTLQPNQAFMLAKAEPGGSWEILGDSAVVDGKLKASVHGFSFFAGIIITYPLPVLQGEPYHWNIALDCGEQDCAALVGPATITYKAIGIGVQLPQPCTQGRLVTMDRDTTVSGSGADTRREFPLTGGTVTTTVAPPDLGFHAFFASLECWNDDSSYFFSGYRRDDAVWAGRPRDYPSLSIARVPTQVDVVEGLPASVEALLFGGAMSSNWDATPPSASDRAVVDWLRSDNEGLSWQEVGKSFQHEGNPQPYGTGMMWAPWSVKHVFTATSADQGALIRANACYTPPAPNAPPPCVASSPVRINVLQHSAQPAIVDAPRSVLIRSGETATFSVNVSGAPVPALRWQTRPANSTGEWTDVNLGSGATTNQYTTPPRALADNGEQYRVLVSNALGSAASTPVTLSVSDLEVAPSITTQPAGLNVTSGNDAVFAVVAIGTEALSYQWRFNGTNLAGANSPVLRLGGVTAADAGNYSVVVSNPAGSATSNGAMLGITAGTPAAVSPSIVTQPHDVTVNVGNTATFAVGATGTGPFAFQWLREGVPVNGATSAVLTFDSVALPNAGGYSVRVTNSAGQVVSDTVLLDVISADVPVAPAITSQPATLIASLDGSATLAVGATGSGPLSYQWYLDGNLLPGSTLPVLTFGHLGEADFGRYTVTVANGEGSVTSQPADLILLGAPVITQQPASVTASEGQSATFTVQANGSGLRYQWSVNGTQIPGAIAATFNTPSLILANTGAVYEVMVYNAAGLVTSQPAVLTVAAPGINATTLVSAELDGGEPDYLSGMPSISADGRFVAFTSQGLNLIAGGTTNGSDSGHAYLRDLATGTTTLIDRTAGGGVSSRGVVDVKLSANGRYALFTSFANDLVADDTNNGLDVFRRDLLSGTTERVNVLSDGGQVEDTGNASYDARLAISGNGRYVAFMSGNDVDVAGDGSSNDGYFLYLRDMLTGVTRYVAGTPATSPIGYVAMSENGWFIAFTTNIVAPGDQTIWLYDTELASTAPVYTYAQSPDPAGERQGLSISTDGRFIAFALNSVALTGSTFDQVMVIDREQEPALATLVSRNDVGAGNGHSAWPQISGDGRYVLFESQAPNLTDGLGLSFRRYAVVRDLVAGTTQVASHAVNGSPVELSQVGTHAMSGDGSTVAFAAQQVYAAPRP
jgi:Tol biopolymer transport system component